MQFDIIAIRVTIQYHCSAIQDQLQSQHN